MGDYSKVRGAQHDRDCLNCVYHDYDFAYVHPTISDKNKKHCDYDTCCVYSGQERVDFIIKDAKVEKLIHYWLSGPNGDSSLSRWPTKTECPFFWPACGA